MPRRPVEASSDKPPAVLSHPIEPTLLRVARRVDQQPLRETALAVVEDDSEPVLIKRKNATASRSRGRLLTGFSQVGCTRVRVAPIRHALVASPSAASSSAGLVLSFSESSLNA